MLSLKRSLHAAVFAVGLLGCGRTELEGPEDIPRTDGGDVVDVIDADRPDVPPGRCVRNADCDDGVFCNGTEQCVAGACQPGRPVACDDGISCTRDRCDEGTGTCAFAPDPRACDDGVFCNGAEVCDPRVGCAPGPAMSCDDGDACTEDRCDEDNRACVSRLLEDEDGDGFAPLRCAGGADCDDRDRNVNPAAPESCRDGRDNNCDGRVDCADPACGRDPVCLTCVPTGPEAALCADGRDNDCNGRVDCADPACAMSPACVMCVPTGPEAGRCADGRDNDCNGTTDCADPACRTDAACAMRNEDCASARSISLPGTARGDTTGARDDLTASCGASTSPDLVYVFRNPTRQTITIDTEGSGYDTVLTVRRMDCSGPEIACDDDSGTGVNSRIVLTDAEPGTYFVAVEGFGMGFGPFQLNLSVGATEVCDNGTDDDGDGRVDCADPDCARAPGCAMCVPSAMTEVRGCTGGRDEDCDGLVDCADPDCLADSACMVCASNEVGACTGGRDEDCDGLTDCADPDCRADPACMTCVPTGPENTAAACSDGRDNDCDRASDCMDPDCAAVPLCRMCVPTGPENTAAACGDGRDNDCDRLVDCADADCAGTPACGTCTPTGPESTDAACSDGRDNDCDTVSDCMDPGCARTTPCLGIPRNDACMGAVTVGVPSVTAGTTRGARDDFTPVTAGFPGCGGGAGPDVVYTFSLRARTPLTIDVTAMGFDPVLYVRRLPCESGEQRACNDDAVGVDSRVSFIAEPGQYFVFVDGFAAGAGGDFSLAINVGLPAEDCGNGLDDDADGNADCADSDCAAEPACMACMPTGPENTAAVCGDGRDNDCNGATDCADAACASTAACCRPTGREGTVATCTDGVDNDCDGQSDCADSDCAPLRAAGGRECCNGRDDDGNSLVDEFACGCASNFDCIATGMGGPIRSTSCYRSLPRMTPPLCGPDCRAVGGDMYCSAFFSGTRCDRATGACVP